MAEETSDNELGSFMRNIAWLRKHHGLSKKKMAELLGIGVETLNKIEQGQFPPRLGVSVMEKLWIHFGIAPSDQFKQLYDI